jgi:hypothetical protein
MEENADLILYNGIIRTIDEENRVIEAVAVKKGEIIAVGKKEDVLPLKTDKTSLLDLDGKTVLPGFIDTHSHVMLTGRTSLGIDLLSAQTIEDIKKKISEKAKKTPKGRWIFAYFMNEFVLEEKREPFKEELDEVTTDHNVVLYHMSFHCAATNTPAFELLGIPVEKDGVDTYEDGTPTGVIRDPAILDLHSKISAVIEDDVKMKSLYATSKKALQNGITTIHALDGGELSPGDVSFLIDHKNEVKVRLVIYPQIMNVERVLELGLPRIGGCILADGALENHTAAIFEPYSDTADNYGALVYSTPVMEKFIMKAHKAGLQIAIHAIGERAIDQILTAYEKALAAHPREDHRHRIEHFEFPTWYQIDRVAKSGVALTMNPGFIPYSYGSDMKLMNQLLGKTRLKRFHPYNQVVNAGILVSGGADSPCSPLDPLGGICYLVIHPVKENRIDVLDAVKMFTINAAKIAFEETEKGSIEIGKVADFVILNKDPFTVDSQGIINIKVEQTIIGGEVVFQNK